VAYTYLSGTSDNPLFKDPVIESISADTGQTAVQVLLMWGLQSGTSVIPKSITPSRISKNFEMDVWALQEDQQTAISGIKTRFKIVNDS
jgi:glycerol 2-dehydrogenase (NADP+)